MGWLLEVSSNDVIYKKIQCDWLSLLVSDYAVTF